MPNMNTPFIVEEFSDKFLTDIEELLRILDSPRAGALFPPTFEDGVRYVYCQILQDTERCKEIIECYTKLKQLHFEEAHVYDQLRNKHYENYLSMKKQTKRTEEK